MTTGISRSDPRLGALRSWVFDLDNTLYPASSSLFGQVQARMVAFLCRELALEPEAAGALRRRYVARHGTTLRGLMIEHKLDPSLFLDYVHDVDLALLPPDPVLDLALARLPGRKLVFTNGTVAYAERVLERLGIGRHFEGIFDIVGCGYLPKPEIAGYHELIRRHGLIAAEAAMVEDLAVNLAPAHTLGMTTVWVPDSAASLTAPAPSHVDHVVAELAPWLAGLSGPAPD
jgi:putative hydrolase of the HAD superfamily